ncbi:FtsQ-type POTRA domain-containing protein [bacterium]|nr:FtsQ-type POTRA domain-containing protein [bacterium]
MSENELSQTYYRRKLNASKMRRAILAQRKRINKIRFLVKLLIAALICAFGLKVLKMRSWYINYEDLNAAKPWVLKIEGNVVTPTYKIVDMIRQTELPNLPLYRLDTKELEQNIEKLEAVENVFVRRFWFPFPARLLVVVQERTPLFVIAPNNETPPISAVTDDGVFIGRDYMPLSTRFKTTKILSYGTKGDDYENWDKNRVQELYKLTKAVETYSREGIVYLDIRNPQDVYIQLESVLVRVGEINDTVLKRARRLTATVPQVKAYAGKVKYIDIRWEDALYMKLEGQSGESTLPNAK